MRKIKTYIKSDYVKTSVELLSLLSFTCTVVSALLAGKSDKESAFSIIVSGWLVGILARALSLNLSILDVSGTQNNIHKVAQSVNIPNDEEPVLDAYSLRKLIFFTVTPIFDLAALIIFAIHRSPELGKKDEETQIDEWCERGGLGWALITMIYLLYYKTCIQKPAKKIEKKFEYSKQITDEMRRRGGVANPELAHNTLVGLLLEKRLTSIIEVFADINAELARLHGVLHFDIDIDSYSSAEVKQQIEGAKQGFIGLKKLAPELEALRQLAKEVIMPYLGKQIENHALPGLQVQMVEDCRAYYEGGQYDDTNAGNINDAMTAALVTITKALRGFDQFDTFFSNSEWSTPLENEMGRLEAFERQKILPPRLAAEELIRLENERDRLSGELEQSRQGRNAADPLISPLGETQAVTKHIQKIKRKIERIKISQQVSMEQGRRIRRRLYRTYGGNLGVVNAQLREARDHYAEVISAIKDGVQTYLNEYLPSEPGSRLEGKVGQMLFETGHLEASHQPEIKFSLDDWRGTLNLVR